MKGFTYSKRNKAFNLSNCQHYVYEIVNIMTPYASCSDSKKVIKGGKLEKRINKFYSKTVVKLNELNGIK